MLRRTEKELQKCQQEIDEFETKVEEMSNLLKKKNEDEKSMTATLKILQKKIEKLQKQNDEVSETPGRFTRVCFFFFFSRLEWRMNIINKRIVCFRCVELNGIIVVSARFHVV